jgi:hypothetical protein
MAWKPSTMMYRIKYLTPQTERDTDCQKMNSGVVKNEAHVLFVCPLQKTLSLKYSELFRDATNFTSAFSSAQIARFFVRWLPDGM